MKRTNLIILVAFLMTVILLISMLLLGKILNDQRQAKINEKFDETYTEMGDIQKLMLISETYGGNMSCIAFKSKLRSLDKKVWDSGLKLEQYRIASEEFEKDPYYLNQKKVFNDNQILYLVLLTQIKKKCNYNTAIITFFYQNSADCKKCDDQSFVLNDIKRDLDNNVSIFSLDVDLNLTSVGLLKESYQVEELPCIIINEKKFCGIQSKDFIMQQICIDNTTGICTDTTLS